jgi:hypothetical protein
LGPLKGHKLLERSAKALGCRNMTKTHTLLNVLFHALGVLKLSKDRLPLDF